MKRIILILIMVVGFFTTANASKTKVGVLIAYDQSAINLYGNKAQLLTRINQIVSITKSIYNESNVELVITGIVFYPKNVNGKSFSKTLDIITSDHRLNSIKSSTGADTIVLLRSTDHKLGGLAISSIWYSLAAVIDPRANLSTMAHELGHNFGLDHSRKQSGDPVYKYGRGYGRTANFVTVMAYVQKFIGSRYPTQLYHFSDPNKKYNHYPIGRKNKEDARRAVENIKDFISKKNKNTPIAYNVSEVSKAKKTYIEYNNKATLANTNYKYYKYLTNKYKNTKNKNLYYKYKKVADYYKKEYNTKYNLSKKYDKLSKSYYHYYKYRGYYYKYYKKFRYIASRYYRYYKYTNNKKYYYKYKKFAKYRNKYYKYAYTYSNKYKSYHKYSVNYYQTAKSTLSSYRYYDKYKKIYYNRYKSDLNRSKSYAKSASKYYSSYNYYRKQALNYYKKYLSINVSY